ncbi:MAG TPA: hypothetical protein PKA64_17240, partial [Myxococcota bacterium]|nr:hypothetical protein [Myxococcota bacterium]
PEDPLTLAVRLPAGDERTALRVEGNGRVLDLPLAWEAVDPPGGSCFDACRAAFVDLWLDGAPAGI